jgi:hypothetical protein
MSQFYMDEFKPEQPDTPIDAGMIRGPHDDSEIG